MNKTYMVIIVLALIAVGVLGYMWHGKKAEAPMAVDSHGQPFEHGDPHENSSKTTVTPSTTTITTASTTTVESNVTDTGEVNVDTTGIKEFRLKGDNFSFIPNTISVNKGDRVRIIFENTEGFHDLKIDEYGVATKQAKAPYQEVLEFTADKAGSFEYYCSVGEHRAMGMVGTLTVK